MILANACFLYESNVNSAGLSDNSSKIALDISFISRKLQNPDLIPNHSESSISESNSTDYECRIHPNNQDRSNSSTSSDFYLMFSDNNSLYNNSVASYLPETFSSPITPQLLINNSPSMNTLIKDQRNAIFKETSTLAKLNPVKNFKIIGKQPCNRNNEDHNYAKKAKFVKINMSPPSLSFETSACLNSFQYSSSRSRSKSSS